jgi:hypothetical protein
MRMRYPNVRQCNEMCVLTVNASEPSNAGLAMPADLGESAGPPACHATTTRQAVCCPTRQADAGAGVTVVVTVPLAVWASAPVPR